MESPYKLCPCGHRFATEAELRRTAVFIGVSPTGDQRAYDLECWNCPGCGTTFTLRCAKGTGQ